jgi:hypothetical protein
MTRRLFLLLCLSAGIGSFVVGAAVWLANH